MGAVLIGFVRGDYVIIDPITKSDLRIKNINT